MGKGERREERRDSSGRGGRRRTQVPKITSNMIMTSSYRRKSSTVQVTKDCESGRLGSSTETTEEVSRASLAFFQPTDPSTEYCARSSLSDEVIKFTAKVNNSSMGHSIVRVPSRLVLGLS